MEQELSGDAGVVPERNQSVRLGVVFERRHIDHPWQEWRWRPVALIPGAEAAGEPRLLCQGDGWAWFHLATLALELFPGETGDYRLNLSQPQPSVYVLWHADEEPPEPFHLTVCHSETQDYLDGGDVMAEGVPMPEPVQALLHAYVAAYHVDVPFRKRQRSPQLAARNSGEGNG
jgi:uncharacterized protein DUF3305